MFLITLSVAYADSRSFTEFTYDEAGNLTGIASDVSNNPPVITDISPPIVRIGSPTVVTATGTDLRGTAISIDDPGIAIRGISTTNTQAQFTVTAPNNTPLGAHTLTFTTSLGSATGVITVQPRLPTLFISPAPIGVPPTGQPVTLNITLSSTDNIAHTINLLMADTSIATVTPTSVTIPAGSIAPIETVTVQGSTLGSTGLNVSSSILAGASIPVFVTDAFIPPKGDNTFNSLLLGVVLETTPQPVLLERGPFTTKLTIVKGSATTPTDTVVGPVASPDLGITVGNVILGLSPRIFIIGTGPQPLTITGLGLNTATTITAIPPDGITLGPLTPSADGKSATASITVSADAPPTLRQIVVSNAGQTFPPASPDVDRITVAYEGPQVTSIDPIVVALGTTSAVLTIRGRNLQNVRAVNVTPASGMVSVSPQANAQGTIVTTQIEIPENVPLGPRVITVTTDAGTTDTTPSPANTLTIVNALAGDVTPVSAADVGVLVGNTSTPTSRILQLHSNDIGVAIGGVVTGMTPSAQSVGSTFTLTIEGSGLGSVDTVRFERPTGLTVGTPTAAADGKSVSVDVTIAPDAPQVVRTVEAVANGVVMPSSPPSANQFLVTGLLPVVNSITPQFVIKGAAPSVLTVLGQNLDGAGRIQVLPPDGIAVSEPTPSADGNSLIFTVSADVNAALGSRMIIVETPAGQSATIASPANSFAVVNNVVSTVTPVISPVLGVNKEQTSSPPTIDRLLLSPVLGVEIQQSGGPATKDLLVTGSNVGLSVGSVANQINPTGIAINSATTLTINGFAMNGVTVISFNPPDGITQTGAFVISPDGSQITVPITVSATALATVREVVLNTAAGKLAFTDPRGSQLRIASGIPEIISIAPIQELQDTQFILLIRGMSLTGATVVNATPPDGITFGNNPTVNANGTELTIDMTIAPDAPPGARVITLTTPGGTTITDALPANTFTVVGP